MSLLPVAMRDRTEYLPLGKPRPRPDPSAEAAYGAAKLRQHEVEIFERYSYELPKGTMTIGVDFANRGETFDCVETYSEKMLGKPSTSSYIVAWKGKQYTARFDLTEKGDRPGLIELMAKRYQQAKDLKIDTDANLRELFGVRSQDCIPTCWLPAYCAITLDEIDRARRHAVAVGKSRAQLEKCYPIPWADMFPPVSAVTTNLARGKAYDEALDQSMNDICGILEVMRGAPKAPKWTNSRATLDKLPAPCKEIFTAKLGEKFLGE